MNFKPVATWLVAMLPTFLFLIGGGVACYGIYSWHEKLGVIVAGIFIVIVAFMIDQAKGGKT